MSVLPVLGKLYSILKYDLVPKNCLNLGKLDYSLHIYVPTECVLPSLAANSSCDMNVHNVFF